MNPFTDTSFANDMGDEDPWGGIGGVDAPSSKNPYANEEPVSADSWGTVDDEPAANQNAYYTGEQTEELEAYDAYSQASYTDEPQQTYSSYDFDDPEPSPSGNIYSPSNYSFDLDEDDAYEEDVFADVDDDDDPFGEFSSGEYTGDLTDGAFMVSEYHQHIPADIQERVNKGGGSVVLVGVLLLLNVVAAAGVALAVMG